VTAEIGKLTVEEGNRGDMAINDWVAAMMSVYRTITGKEPATSVGPNRGDEGSRPARLFVSSPQRAVHYNWNFLRTPGANERVRC
jgi:hypothetical protein